MKRLLFLVFMLPTFLIAQETKKVTENHKNPEYKEVYYVLKSDKSIKQGNYQKFDYRKNLRINGFYKNGVKDSIWEFYDNNRKLEQKFNYTTRELLFNQKDTSKNNKYKAIKGTDTAEVILDRPPIYIGGVDSYNEFLAENVNYPEDARESQITGTVYILFTIDKDGKASDYRVGSGPNYEKDKDAFRMGSLKREALRVVKLIPASWLPGILNDKPVTIQYFMPIKFTLN